MRRETTSPTTSTKRNRNSSRPTLLDASPFVSIYFCRDLDLTRPLRVPDPGDFDLNDRFGLFFVNVLPREFPSADPVGEIADRVLDLPRGPPDDLRPVVGRAGLGPKLPGRLDFLDDGVRSPSALTPRPLRSDDAADVVEDCLPREAPFGLRPVVGRVALAPKLRGWPNFELDGA